MRFTVPFLLACIVFVATIVGANQTSLTLSGDSVFDMLSAAQSLAFRLERALGVPTNAALIVGAGLLSLPALATFHLFRVGFGGAIESIVQDHAMTRKIAKERERATAAKYATAPDLNREANDTSSGTTSLGGDTVRDASTVTDVSADAPVEARQRGRWSGVLENRPDLSKLKSGAKSLGERIGGGRKATSLADLADDAGDKS
ncbi:MAG: hypothetical protein AAGJ70_00140 [Pseudomonadota bacterium]